MKPIRSYAAAGTLAAILAPGAASAAVYGSLANFDVVNDTGKPAYGFEIQIEDASFDHSRITSVFGLNRDFGLPAGPGAVVRYGTPTIIDQPGVGVLIRYGGNVGPVFTPSAPYNTPGDSCWPFGAGWSTATSCDHFGVSTLGQPANTRYSWLVETAPGSGLLTTLSAALPPVVFAPPVNNQVNVQINAVAPNHDQPENEGLWGQPFWVKSFTANVNHNVDLGNLFRNDPDQKNAEVETEWFVFQKAPAGEVGGNDQKDAAIALGPNDKALIRRYEFYEYLGPLKADGEANCSKGCDKDPHGLDPANPHADWVGKFVGQQMAGFNAVEDQQGIVIPNPAVPEPSTYAMMAGGLGMLVMLARRRGKPAAK